MEQSVKDFLKELRKKVTIGTVGGSDFTKAKEQMGEDSEWFRFRSAVSSQRFHQF